MSFEPRKSDSTRKTLEAILSRRVMVMDGAMATMIQSHGLGEADFRGEQFADHPAELKGCNDLLSLTQPDIIAEIHRAYLEAGADIIETNTFNSTRIALSDYDLQDKAYDINRASAELARKAADEATASNTAKPRFVAGAMGPTNRTLSISPDVNDPGYRNVTFEELAEAYAEAARGLIDGGVDILLVETIFDTLNAKAALFAIDTVFEEMGVRVPVMVSGTITDASGRTLSGQTTEAFYASVSHMPMLSIGLNCALGSREMHQYLSALNDVASQYISCYPNAGLPNEFGEYDETPDYMAGQAAKYVKDGLANIVGSCCGSTPEHTRAIAQAVAGLEPRKPSVKTSNTLLSGLEPLEIRPDSAG